MGAVGSVCLELQADALLPLQLQHSVDFLPPNSS
jgi:hypothetical protein